MAGRDITEGRATRAIAVDLNIATGNVWINTGNAYEVAIGGIPFLTAVNDQRPYERATAPFRKQQFDSQRDPGEQSLSNWWIRSQSSFHAGEGILYFDPYANPYSQTLGTNSYRVKATYGVDIWEPGKVTLLHDVARGHNTLTAIDSTYGRPRQRVFSAKWDGKNGIILHDGYDLDRIDTAGNVEHWVDYNTGTADPVFAATSDGATMYWVTNDTASGKLRMEKKLISASTSTTPTTMFTHPSGETVTRGTIGYVKQRLVLGANNKIYEFPTNQSSMPSPIYTHPSSSYVYSSVAESGTSIYISGYEGIKSSIFRFTLDETTGAMPVLTSPITAAEMPAGEIIHRIFNYLGYLMIGTSKGVRVAKIENDGSLTYGPIIVHTAHPVYDFCARDSFVWCATSIERSGIEPGLIRIDLSTEIEGLRFAYANDLHYTSVNDETTTSCAFMGDTNQIAFCSAANIVGGTIVNKAAAGGVATLTTASAHGLTIDDIGVAIYVEGVDATFNSAATSDYVITSVPSTTTFTYTIPTTSTVTSAAVSSASAVVKLVGYTYIEDATELITDGYIETGLIRYNTLEPKNYKRIMAHGDYTYGSMSLQTVDLNNTIYDVNSYDAIIGHPESTITQPVGAQDALGLRFHLYRDATDPTKGPTFEGYQLKAVPATPRNRVIKIPLLCFDMETDKYNNMLGYEGRAYDRLTALEHAEENGDIVVWQDFRVGETYQVLIEEVAFTDTTPPDKRLNNFGGIITLTIRTV